LLTADLVSVRASRDGVLSLPELKERDREILRTLGASLLDATHAGVGRSRAEAVELRAAVDVHPKLARAARALIRLIDDRSRYAGIEGGHAPALRTLVFTEAARARRELNGGARFDRDAFLDVLARAQSTTPSDIESRLFSDLKAQDTLLAVDIVDADELVARYEIGRLQAMLLRAENVVVRLCDPGPEELKRLIRALRFHQLLFVAEHDAGMLELRIDGPLSVLEATTRYGLKLALVVPHLIAAGAESLAADVRHGHARRKMRFVPTSLAPHRAAVAFLGVDALGERPEVRTVRDGMARQSTWRVHEAHTVLVTPGTGVIVPDLVCTHEDGSEVLLEVLGYWSRDAVWARVDMATTGLLPPIVFAAPARLRVDARALSSDVEAELLVFKDAIGMRALVSALERVRSRAQRSSKKSSSKQSSSKQSSSHKGSSHKASSHKGSSQKSSTRASVGQQRTSKKSTAKKSTAKKSTAKSSISKKRATNVRTRQKGAGPQKARALVLATKASPHEVVEPQ